MRYLGGTDERERVVLGVFEFLKRKALVCCIPTHHPKHKRIFKVGGAAIIIAFLSFGFAGCNNNEIEADRQPAGIEKVDNNEQGGEQESTLEWWEEPYQHNAADLNEAGSGMINRERLNERELSLLDMPASNMTDEDRAAFIYTMGQIYRRWSNNPQYHSGRRNTPPFKLIGSLSEDTTSEDIEKTIEMITHGLFEISYTSTAIPNRELMAKTRIAAFLDDTSGELANSIHRNTMDSIPADKALTVRAGETAVTNLAFDQEAGVATFNMSYTNANGRVFDYEKEAREHEFTCPRTGEIKTIVLFNILFGTDL